MTLPTFPASPPAPQRGVDSDEEFRPKADAFASWWAELPEALQEWIVGVVQAIGAANYSATSISSVAIGTGAKSFNVDSGKMFVAGQFLIVADSAAPTTNFMFGQVSGYHSVSGVLDLNVIYVQGSGTKSAWTIGLSAAAANLTTALNLVHTGTPSEDVYTIVDGPSVDIDPANGSIQFWTLGASRVSTTSVSALPYLV